MLVSKENKGSYPQLKVIDLKKIKIMMNFTSIIAISKESKNAIITKYIPINLLKQFKLKMFLGLISNMFSSFLLMVFYYMCTKNIVNTLILFIILVEINLFGEKIKLLIDLSKPQLTWDNEYTMMKQNTNVMYELFYTLILGVILLLLSKLIVNINMFLIINIIIFAILNIIISKYVKKYNYDIFGKIY